MMYGDFLFLKSVLLKNGVSKTIGLRWIFPENQYTAGVYSNLRMVNNIRHSGGCYTTIHYNLGKRRVTHEATLKGVEQTIKLLAIVLSIYELPWENSLAVLEVLILVCSSSMPRGTLSTCLRDTPILGSGHVWLYPLDTVPT